MAPRFHYEYHAARDYEVIPVEEAPVPAHQDNPWVPPKWLASVLLFPAVLLIIGAIAFLIVCALKVYGSL